MELQTESLFGNNFVSWNGLLPMFSELKTKVLPGRFLFVFLQKFMSIRSFYDIQILPRLKTEFFKKTKPITQKNRKLKQ